MSLAIFEAKTKLLYLKAVLSYMLMFPADIEKEIPLVKYTRNTGTVIEFEEVGR